jgi:hypothetical protein
MEVPLNGITSVPNFMRFNQAFQKLKLYIYQLTFQHSKGHTASQTERQTGDLISLLSFLESRLK